MLTRRHGTRSGGSLPRCLAVWVGASLLAAASSRRCCRTWPSFRGCWTVPGERAPRSTRSSPSAPPYCWPAARCGPGWSPPRWCWKRSPDGPGCGAGARRPYGAGCWWPAASPSPPVPRPPPRQVGTTDRWPQPSARASRTEPCWPGCRCPTWSTGPPQRTGRPPAPGTARTARGHGRPRRHALGARRPRPPPRCLTCGRGRALATALAGQPGRARPGPRRHPARHPPAAPTSRGRLMSPFHDNVTPLPGPRPGDAAAWSVLASIQGTLALDLDDELGPPWAPEPLPLDGADVVPVAASTRRDLRRWAMTFYPGVRRGGRRRPTGRPAGALDDPSGPRGTGLPGRCCRQGRRAPGRSRPRPTPGRPAAGRERADLLRRR